MHLCTYALMHCITVNIFLQIKSPTDSLIWGRVAKSARKAQFNSYMSLYAELALLLGSPLGHIEYSGVPDCQYFLFLYKPSGTPNQGTSSKDC